MKTSEWTAECTLVQFVFVLCYLNPLVWCLLWIVLLHFIKLQCEMCSSRSTSTMLYVHCLNIHESIGNCTTAAATKAQKRKTGKKSWILCVSLFSFSVCLVLLHSLFWSRFFFVSCFFWSFFSLLKTHPFFICTIWTTHIHILSNLSPFYICFIRFFFVVVQRHEKLLLLCSFALVICAHIHHCMNKSMLLFFLEKTIPSCALQFLLFKCIWIRVWKLYSISFLCECVQKTYDRSVWRLFFFPPFCI